MSALQKHIYLFRSTSNRTHVFQRTGFIEEKNTQRPRCFTNLVISWDLINQSSVGKLGVTGPIFRILNILLQLFFTVTF